MDDYLNWTRLVVSPSSEVDASWVVFIRNTRCCEGKGFHLPPKGSDFLWQKIPREAEEPSPCVTRLQLCWVSCIILLLLLFVATGFVFFLLHPIWDGREDDACAISLSVCFWEWTEDVERVVIVEKERIDHSGEEDRGGHWLRCLPRQTTTKNGWPHWITSGVWVYWVK